MEIISMANNKLLSVLITILLAVFGWIGANVYDATRMLDRRLTTVEATLIDRTEAIQRLSVLEDRVNRLHDNHTHK